MVLWLIQGTLEDCVGFVGLVGGIDLSNPHFESPQSAHGERNGVTSSPPPCPGKRRTKTDAISVPVIRLG